MTTALQLISNTTRESFQDFIHPLKNPWTYVVTGLLTATLLYGESRCREEQREINQRYSQITNENVNTEDFSYKNVKKRLDFIRSQNVDIKTPYTDFFKVNHK